MKRLVFAVCAIVLAQIVTVSAARADCSAGTRLVLAAASNSYGQWQSDSNDSAEASKAFAKSYWASFEQHLDWIVDNGNIDRCPRGTKALYYTFSATRDAARMVRLYALHQTGLAGVPDATLEQIVDGALDVYYNDVRELYYLKYARTNPTEYARFKRNVGNWFTTLGRNFTSWENTTAPKPAVSRGCATPNVPANIVTVAKAEFPDDAKGVGLGKATIGVTVTVGQSSSLVDGRVTDTSFNPSFDNAALAAALKSSYAPAVRDCQPAIGTLLVPFEAR